MALNTASAPGLAHRDVQPHSEDVVVAVRAAARPAAGRVHGTGGEVAQRGCGAGAERERMGRCVSYHAIFT